MKTVPAPTPSVRRAFLRARWRMLTRRLRGPVGLVAVLLVGLAVFGLAYAGPALAAGLATEVQVRDTVFWAGTLAALVFSYTSFEVFFRAPDARLLAALPVPGAARFDDLFVRAVLLHLPLLLPAAALAWGFATSPGPHPPGAALYALLVPTTQLVFGLPVAICLHLLAGRSLLGQSNGLRKVLAGASVPDDAALLVYAPAVGLLATLVGGIFVDLFLRDALMRQKTSLLAPVLLGGLAIGVWATVQARKIAATSLHLILPRFGEVDVPPPYREDGVRKVVPGEGLGRFLPPATLPYFLRDIRQIRRRHRLDRVLVLGFFFAALKLAHGGPAPGWRVVIALTLMNGVFIVSAFRLRGELASPWLDRTLPDNRRMAALGRLAATAHHPLVALGLATLATLTTGDVGSAALVLGAGLGLTVALLVASDRLAELGRGRAGLTASLWRVAVASLCLIAGGLV